MSYSCASYNPVHTYTYIYYNVIHNHIIIALHLSYQLLVYTLYISTYVGDISTYGGNKGHDHMNKLNCTGRMGPSRLSGGLQLSL